MISQVILSLATVRFVCKNNVCIAWDFFITKAYLIVVLKKAIMHLCLYFHIKHKLLYKYKDRLIYKFVPIGNYCKLLQRPLSQFKEWHTKI